MLVRYSSGENDQLEILTYNTSHVMDSEKEMFYHYFIWN